MERHAADALFIFSHLVAAFSCIKWRRGYHFEIMTSNQKSDSVSRCTFCDEHSAKFHPDPILNGGAFSFFCKMTLWPPFWKYDVISEIWCVDASVNPAKFHPDTIWNDGALGFGRGHPNEKKHKNKMSSDRRSVPDLKTLTTAAEMNYSFYSFVWHFLLMSVVLWCHPVMFPPLYKRTKLQTLGSHHISRDVIWMWDVRSLENSFCFVCSSHHHRSWTDAQSWEKQLQQLLRSAV